MLGSNTGASQSTVLVLVLLLSGCHGAPAPSSPATAAVAFCSQISGRWDKPTARCTITRDKVGGTRVKITAAYPGELVGDPTAGPVLQDFLRKFVDNFGTPDGSGSGDATLQYSTSRRMPATESVVFKSDWYLQRMPHPVAALTTFTFDLSRHRRLQLGDLFCRGIDPQGTLPASARPAIEQRLKGSPFEVAEFEPGGALFDGYAAWTLDGDDLVLYLPATRGPGGIPPGFVQPHISLATLNGALDGRCPI